MTERIKQPYVGVSGVVSPLQQRNLESISEEFALIERGRVLALGVKAVHKTQYLDVENKYGNEWYPVGQEAFASALRKADPADTSLNVAQAYLDVDHVHDADYRNDFVARIAERGEPWLQAVQFDMLPWHKDTATLSFLEDLKNTHSLQILLQCHKAAMEDLGPTGVTRRLGSYAHVLDYVLFDSSHGTGLRLDTARLDPFIAEAYTAFDPSQTGVALAGGLNGQIVREDLPPMLEKYPNLSWDAEGQLHPVNADNKRPLDMQVTREYLKASSEILRH